MTVKIQTADFDVSAEIAALRKNNPKIGAVASFIGVVRDINDGGAVAEMTLEHYPGMTEKAIEEIIVQAKGRWQVLDALVIHRVGTLKPTDQIVLVIVTSGHKEGCVRGMRVHHGLSKDAGAVLKEQGGQGARWVEARATDDIAAERWRLKG